MTEKYKKLEDYGLIGNLETCALIAKDGSLDWCCFPHIESPSVFAAILDIDNGGHFWIKPKGEFESQQLYVEKTNIIETKLNTSSGVLYITDFMPVELAEGNTVKKHQAILRKITCSRGMVEVEVSFKPRFDYARAVPSLNPVEEGIIASWQDKRLFLQFPFSLTISNGEAYGKFNIRQGQTYWFVLRYGSSEPVSSKECERLLEKTKQFWLNWVHRCQGAECVFGGSWHDRIVRSGLVLKLLTHPASGAIIAAPTTSLPEEIGGVRNWDYRFAWIRDASFTVQALFNLGHVQEAMDYFKWLRNICKSSVASEIKIMYGPHGELDLEEKKLEHLSGYRDSRPVRIGNAAAKQRQFDIYGELINVFYETSRYGEDISLADWQFIKKISDYVSGIWDTEDSGIWEVRGGPKHFTYSKLMCWVTLDRSIKIAEKKGFDGSVERWKEVRNQLQQAILERGFSRKLNSFVQAFDSEVLDATSLLIPMMGFLPFNDPRVIGTIKATMERLMTNGLVNRYEGDDGLPGKEGTFVLCTFWLVEALALSGQADKAEEIFTGLLKHISPLGLFAEEINPISGEQLGNYPQAFSHIGLINSALYLGIAKGRKQMGPEPLGT